MSKNPRNVLSPLSGLPKNGPPVRLSVLKDYRPEFSTEVPFALELEMANGTRHAFVSASLNKTLCPIDSQRMTKGRVPIALVVTSPGRSLPVQVVFIIKYDGKHSRIITPHNGANMVRYF